MNVAYVVCFLQIDCVIVSAAYFIHICHERHLKKCIDSNGILGLSVFTFQLFCNSASTFIHLDCCFPQTRSGRNVCEDLQVLLSFPSFFQFVGYP